MKKTIEIICENNKTRKYYELGTSLHEIIVDQNIYLKYPILGAKVNNDVEELSYQIFKPKVVKFFDISDVDGARMYVRSLWFVLMKAVKDLYPDAILKIEHSVSKGFYCEIENSDNTSEIVEAIRHRMQQIVEEDIPFVRKDILVSEAMQLFEENNYFHKVKLFQTCPELYTSVYHLGNLVDYFYGYLVPSTGFLTVFDLVTYQEGMLLRIPKRSNPTELEDVIEQPKLFEIFREYKRWSKILGVETIGSINEAVLNKQAGELIKISEALHEKKVGKIADEIKNREKVRLILISGPSSSGKTTFCKRLAVQMKAAGLKPFQISLDNYFVDREHTPKDEHGEYDFESLDALDVKLFNENLLDLLTGNEVSLPKFSFTSGTRFYTGEKLQISQETILLIEGIHALNPNLTLMIPNELKFKIYVSALTQIGIDGHNRIPTTDNRLLRRIIRDHQYRGYSALNTLQRWPSVRRGEEKYIFPFQEEADVMFNSALLFELGVLKSYAEPLLHSVPQFQPEYSEAMRLLKFLSYFQPISDKELPPTSILREFLSGSTFDYS